MQLLIKDKYKLEGRLFMIVEVNKFITSPQKYLSLQCDVLYTLFIINLVAPGQEIQRSLYEAKNLILPWVRLFSESYKLF
jgi:hypothetical protein